MNHLINSVDFETIIKDGIWLVDFSAIWCGPCRMLEPVLEEFSKNHNVLKIDVDKFQDLAIKFGIMSVPSLLVFNNGKLLKQTAGYKTIEQLEELVK